MACFPISADILHICVFKAVFASLHPRGKHQSVKGAGYRRPARVNCGNSLKEPADVRDFIIHSQSSSTCSAVPGTAPPRQAGYVKELPGIGGV